jgi:carboxymethylenebutenolidase
MSDLTSIGPLEGYLAKPSRAVPGPAILVIQEWWGLDAQTRSIADRFSGLGYLAFAPDLYHGEAAAPGDSQAASALLAKYGPGAPDELAAVFDALSQHLLCDARVGSIGFCFGGRMSLALGVRRPVQAVCTFYGGQMQQLFDQLHRLKAPVLGLFGDRDQSIPKGTIQAFDELLNRIGVEHEIVVYPNSGHAFFRDTDPGVYKPEAAQDAWQRTTRFFSKHLPIRPMEHSR